MTVAASADTISVAFLALPPRGREMLGFAVA